MKLARILFLLALLAALALLVAGPGVRAGLWTFGSGFQLMRMAAYLGMGVIALSVLLLLVPKARRMQSRTLLAALLIAVVVVAVPWYGLRQARTVPPIHDITTDMDDPPTFVAVLPLRADASNAADYEGSEIAEQQRAGYPDLSHLQVNEQPGAAFDGALQAAKSMGWDIVQADPASGRIEATDTTFWFGFKDDVVIRVRPAGEGSRIDVRSVSRVGGSDAGANAARIEAYLDRLRE